MLDPFAYLFISLRQQIVHFTNTGSHVPHKKVLSGVCRDHEAKTYPGLQVSPSHEQDKLSRQNNYSSKVGRSSTEGMPALRCLNGT